MKVYCLQYVECNKNGKFLNSTLCGIFKSEKLAKESMGKFMLEKDITEDLTGNKFFINECEIDLG